MQEEKNKRKSNVQSNERGSPNVEQQSNLNHTYNGPMRLLSSHGQSNIGVS
jgi:hypothetical protein